MSDERKHPASNVPVPAPEWSAPAPISVELPSGDAWFGRRKTILRKNAAQVRAHAEFLDARSTQAASARAYVESKIALVRSAAQLAYLPEILEHDYRLGREARRHEMAMTRLSHATAEAQSQAVLAGARQHLALLEPSASTPTGSHLSSAPGLSPTEIEDVIRNSLPEITPETLRSLVLLLRGAVDEKKG